jgi:hypothetical protein
VRIGIKLSTAEGRAPEILHESLTCAFRMRLKMYLSVVSINLLMMTGIFLESWLRDYSIPGVLSVLVNCKNVDREVKSVLSFNG